MKRIVISALLATFCLVNTTHAKHHKTEYTDSLIKKLDQNCDSVEAFKAVLKDAIKHKKINKKNCPAIFALVAVMSLCEWSPEMLDELTVYLEKQKLLKYLE